MSDTENTTHNQEEKQDPSTQQGSNGFEVLSNDNSTSTDRKDEIEGEQHNPAKNEQSNEQQDASPENREDHKSHEAADGEQHAHNEPAQNEDQPKSPSKHHAHGHEENQTTNDQTAKEGASEEQTQPTETESPKTHHEQTQHEQKQEQQAGEGHNEQAKPEETQVVSPTQQQHQKAAEIQKEKRGIFVPNYTAGQAEEEEKKSPQQQQRPAGFPAGFPQQFAGQNPQQFYQQLAAQQAAFQQAALQRAAAFQQQQQQAAGQQAQGQQTQGQGQDQSKGQGQGQGQVTPFNPQAFNPGAFNPANFNPANFNPANFNPANFNPANFNPANFNPQALQGGLPQQFLNPFGQMPFGQMPFMQQQPTFLPILDVCAEYQKGSFLPGIHCLYYNMVPKDYIDSTGYNILHHAISYNNVEVVIALLDHLKLDIHLKSKTNQSSVMIASKFGFNEMVNILIDRGGKLDEQDDTRFTALLYCIKQGHLSTFLYLLSRGANYKLTDVNGCSVVHWAAYKNNVFLLRFFRRLGMEMNEVDLAGFTPLQRAVSADAVHAVKYLIEDLKIPVPSALQPDTISNLPIKKMVTDNLPSQKGVVDKKNSLYKMFEKHSQAYTFGFYLLNLVVAFLCYSAGIVNQNELNYVYHIIFFVFALYFVAYSYWYYLKSSDSILKLKSFAYQRLGGGHDTSTIIDSSREMVSIRSPYKHDYLDNLISKSNFSLIDKKEDPDYPYPSFLHELYFNVEKGDWEAVAAFEDKKYCPTTLLRKKPKSKYCKETNSVVEGFNHYSYTLKRPIDKNSHPFYLLLLVQQTSLLFLYVFASVLTFYNQRTGSILMIIPETVYLQTTKTGVLVGAYLLLAIIYLGYSTFFTLIELWCLGTNLTYNEFFNSHRYPYLYRFNPFATGPSQQFVKVFYNPDDKGPFKNICNYVSRIFH